MEEILASIRRIISEDEPANEAAEEPAAAAPEPAPEPPPEPVKAEEPPPAPEPDPEPVAVAPEPEPEPAPAPVAAAEEGEDDDDELELTQKVETVGDLDVVEHEPAPPEAPGLVSQPAALAAASAFGALSAAIGMPRTDRTLEDVVRELLQPLLKQWLDDNLPKIVQEAVQAEVERISRARVR